MSYTPTEEHRQKISEAKKGRRTVVHTPETLARIANANRGRTRTAETRARMRSAALGRTHTDETRHKLSHIAKQRVLAGTHNTFVDGRCAERAGERIVAMQTLEYKLWREAVLKRDNYKCQACGSGKSLHADHIQPWVTHPELRYALNNGRTLCAGCHRKTPTYGMRARSKN